MRVDPLVSALQDRRLDLGMSLAEVARCIGISDALLGMAERGETFAFRHLRPWVEALDCELTLTEAS